MNEGIDLIQNAVEHHADRVCMLTRALRLIKTLWPNGLPESWVKSVHLYEESVKFKIDDKPVKMTFKAFFKADGCARSNFRTLTDRSMKNGMYLLRISLHSVDLSTELTQVGFHLEEESRDRNAWNTAWNFPIHAFDKKDLENELVEFSMDYML